jgi:glycosyltransferase involved in cell wall biosynthesis
MDSKLIPEISVILPVYNAENFVSEAIESILNQTFTNFELFIIDDASTDKSVEIIKSYSDKRIILIQKPLNTGYANSLNIGIELSKGSFIARMDADDISLPNRLLSQINYLHKHPDIGLVGSWVKYFGTTNGEWQYPITCSDCFAELLFNNPMAHPTVMFRKKIWNDYKLAYRPDRVPTEDYDLWVQFSEFTHLANIPEYCLKYRIHNDQISKTKESITQGIIDKIWEEFLQIHQIKLTDNSYQVLTALRKNKTTHRLSIHFVKQVKILFNELVLSKKFELVSLRHQIIKKLAYLFITHKPYKLFTGLYLFMVFPEMMHQLTWKNKMRILFRSLSW